MTNLGYLNGVLRLCGAATLVALLALLLMLLAALTTATNRASLVPWVESLAVVVALGTLIMVVHLNLTKRVPPADKAKWRCYLLWGGPLVASWYLITLTRLASTSCPPNRAGGNDSTAQGI